MKYCVKVDHGNAGSVHNFFYALGTTNKMAVYLFLSHTTWKLNIDQVRWPPWLTIVEFRLLTSSIIN